MKFLGIDWAQEFHDVALLDENGNVQDRWRLPHSLEGVGRLLDRLTAEGGPHEVLAGIESGAPLLLDQLLGANYTVYRINPKQLDRYRDRHTVAGTKDDTLDSVVLADAVRTDRHRMRPLEPDSDLCEEIRLRDRARTRRVHEQVRLEHQLRDLLRRFFPAALALNRDMKDPFLLHFLRTYPDPRKARAARTPRLRKLLAQHRIRALSAEGVAKILRAPALEPPAYVIEASRDEVLHLVAAIELANRQIAEVDARLDELLKRHPDREILRSLPGLANRLSVRVVAELGDSRDRYRDRNSIAVYAGSAPVTRRTGKRGVISVRMRRGCNRNLQAALFVMARCSRAKSVWARAYYKWARAHGLRHAAALRSLSNKWAKILQALLSRGETYDEARHIANLVKCGVDWAQDLGPEAPREEAA